MLFDCVSPIGTEEEETDCVEVSTLVLEVSIPAQRDTFELMTCASEQALCSHPHVCLDDTTSPELKLSLEQRLLRLVLQKAELRSLVDKLVLLSIAPVSRSKCCIQGSLLVAETGNVEIHTKQKLQDLNLGG